MKLVYSSQFLLGTDGVLIKKGAVPGNGIYPTNYGVKLVFIEPADPLKAISIKGIDGVSDWIDQPSGGGYKIDRLNENNVSAFYAKSTSGTITVNLYVEGD